MPTSIPFAPTVRVCGGSVVRLGAQTFCGGAVDDNGVLYHVTQLAGWESMPVRQDPIERPFQHGDYDDVGWYGARTIALMGRLDCPSVSALEEARDDLLELTDALDRDLLLVCRERQANVRLAGEMLTSRLNPNTLRFQIPLKAANPRRYGTAARTLTLSVGQSGTANNAGRFRAGAPVIATFTGPLTNPLLTVAGVTFGLTGTVSSGQVVVVDTLEDSVLYSTGISAYALVTGGSTYPSLPPRAASAVSLAGSGAGTVRLDWRDTYR